MNSKQKSNVRFKESKQLNIYLKPRNILKPLHFNPNNNKLI
jgi:hypothetical protein